MKRATSTSLISKWKKAFSGSRQTPETNGTSLTLIKKETVTFSLSRLENPKDFERMCFAAKACAKSSGFLYRTVLHVEQTRTGSRLVATDGQRMHVAEISKKIKSGDYKAHVTKDVISLGEPVKGVKFPAWAKAIPVEKAQKRGVINLTNSGLGKDRKETEKLAVALISFVKQTGEPVNLRYLDDLTKREWVVYSQNEKRKSIMLKENGKPDEKNPVAVILPISQAA